MVSILQSFLIKVYESVGGVSVARQFLSTQTHAKITIHTHKCMLKHTHTHTTTNSHTHTEEHTETKPIQRIPPFDTTRVLDISV